MAVVDIGGNDFEDKVIKAEKPVLVDFWAPWCGPCKMAGPVLEELSEKYKDKISLVKVNVDENQESAQKYSVMSIPTIIIFKGGKEVARDVGFSGKQEYEEMIKKAI